MDEYVEKKGFIAKEKENIREIYEHRVELMALIRRNTAGRYKNTFLGFGWHLLMPILTTLVLYVAFTSIRARPVEDLWIYLSAGIFPVTFLSGCLRGRVIQNSANYIKKMYLPKEIFVLAETITNFLTLIFSYMFIIIVILASGQPVNWFGMALLPLELILMFLFGIGMSMIMSTISVYVQDVGHIVSVVMRLIIWVTPTFFFMSEVEGKLLGTIAWMNPFTYFVETFHKILYYNTVPDLKLIMVSIFISVVVLIVGKIIFNRYKDNFAEVL